MNHLKGVQTYLKLVNPFHNQEHQQKAAAEKTKHCSLTLHCVQIRELTFTFDLLSKRVKYGCLHFPLPLITPLPSVQFEWC